MGRGVVPALVLITGVGAFARLLFLLRPVGYDEGYSLLIYASGPLSHIVGSYYPNNHILHTLAMTASVAVFGSEPWAIRIPALVAGMMCIPAAFVLGRQLHGDAAGLIAAALTAGSSVLIEYSTNARGYTMLALATLLLFTSRAFVLREPRRGAIAAAVIGALGIFTVPVMLFAVAAWTLWIAATFGAVRERRHVRRRLGWLAGSILLMAALTVLLYAPAVLRSGLDAVIANPWVRSLPFHEVITAGPGAVLGAASDAARDWPGGAVLLVAGTVVAMASRRAAWPVRILAPAALLGVIALAGLQRVVPHPRMLIGLLPLAYVTTAVGLAILLRALLPGPARARATAPVAAVALACIGAIASAAGASFPVVNETGALVDAPRVTSALEGELEPGDVVLVRVPGNVPLYYYMQRRGIATTYLSLSPTDWLHRGLESARRVYLVVNEPVESLADVEAELEPWTRRYGPARRVASFPHATLFVREPAARSR